MPLTLYLYLRISVLKILFTNRLLKPLWTHHYHRSDTILQDIKNKALFKIDLKSLFFYRYVGDLVMICLKRYVKKIVDILNFKIFFFFHTQFAIK